MAGDLASNSLAFGVSNNGGNKLDSFLHIDVDLNDAASREASPWDIAGTVTVTNTATGHEPDYVAGQVASRPRSEYQGFLVVNVSPGAHVADLTGATGMWAAGPDGSSFQLVQRVQLLPGASATYELRLELPKSMDVFVLGASGRSPSISRHMNGRLVVDVQSEIDRATTQTTHVE